MLARTTGGWAQSNMTGALVRNGVETPRHTQRRRPYEDGGVRYLQAKECLNENHMGTQRNNSGQRLR